MDNLSLNEITLEEEKNFQNLNLDRDTWTQLMQYYNWFISSDNGKKSTDSLWGSDPPVTEICMLLGGLCCLSNDPVDTKLGYLLRLYNTSHLDISQTQLENILVTAIQGVQRIIELDLNREYKENYSYRSAVNILAVVNNLVTEIFASTEDDVVSAAYVCEWAVKHDLDLLHMAGIHAPTRRQSMSTGPRQVTGDAPLRGFEWQVRSGEADHPVPCGRFKHAACALEGCVYIHGGKSGTLAQKDLWKWELAEDKWTKLRCKGDSPALLQEHTMLGHKRKIYAFGGEFACNGSDDTPLWILDLDTLVWTKHQIAHSEVLTPPTRRSHTSVLYNRCIYIYGGYMDLRGSTSELWIFDIAQSMWHLAYSTQMCHEGPGARHGHSAVVHDGCMWVYGGMMDLQAKADLWKWDFRIRAWSKIKFKIGPPELHGHTACKVGEFMLIFGGESGSNGVLQNDLWIFNFKSQIWTKISSKIDIPSARTNHCAVIIPAFLCGISDDCSVDGRSKSVPHLRPEKNVPVSRPHTSPGQYNDPQTCVQPLQQHQNQSTRQSNRIDLLTGQDLASGDYCETSFIDLPAVVEAEVSGASTMGGGELRDTRSVHARTGKAKRRTRKFSSSENVLLASQQEDLPLITKPVDVSCHEFESFSFMDRCYDNPMFKDSISSRGSIPLKKIRHSLDSLDNISKEPLIRFSSAESVISFDYVVKNYQQNKTISTENMLRACQRDLKPLRSQKETFMRSDSLDILMDRIGGVQIDFSAHPEPTEIVLGNSADLVLEDIEDVDIESLQSSHVYLQNQSGYVDTGHVNEIDQSDYSLQSHCSPDVHNGDPHWSLVNQPGARTTETQNPPDLLVDLTPHDPPLPAAHPPRHSISVVPPLPLIRLPEHPDKSTSQHQLHCDLRQRSVSHPVNSDKHTHSRHAVATRNSHDDSARNSIQEGTPRSQIRRSRHPSVRGGGSVCMLILGGREKESFSVSLRPMSIWQLNLIA